MVVRQKALYRRVVPFDKHFKVNMNLSKGTISGILKDAEKWKDASESYAVEAKKLRLAHEPKLEEALVFWLDTCTRSNPLNKCPY